MLYADGGVSSTQDAGKLRMQGKDVFKHAVTNIAANEKKAIRANNRAVRIVADACL